MRLQVVSDVHGASKALAALEPGSADAFICLGDLILFIDYEDHGRGIFGELFGAEQVSRYVTLRTAGDYDGARAISGALWASLADDPREVIRAAVRRQYAELFSAMPTPAYLTYGNVDLPDLWPEYLRDGMYLLDGETAEIGGLVFGFVGGGLPSPMRTPYEVPEELYAQRVAALGEVDVLCSHLPPAVPELCYDTVARRFERGSSVLLDAIRRTQPRYALFGHVHQPLARRIRVGRTECVNVGHFASTGAPYLLELTR